MEPVPRNPETPGAAPDPTTWHDIAAVDDLPTDGGGSTFEIGERAVAVFRVAGELFAVSDTCPHAGASLGMGVVVGGEVACPWHSFHFDLATGRNTDGLACRIKVHAVRQAAGGRVEVGLRH